MLFLTIIRTREDTLNSTKWCLNNFLSIFPYSWLPIHRAQFVEILIFTSTWLNYILIPILELLLFGVVTWPTLIWCPDMSAIGVWKLKLEAGGFLPVAGSTDGASPIKHTTDILSRDEYVYKVTCLGSYNYGYRPVISG